MRKAFKIQNKIIHEKINKFHKEGEEFLAILKEKEALIEKKSKMDSIAVAPININ